MIQTRRYARALAQRLYIGGRLALRGELSAALRESYYARYKANPYRFPELSAPLTVNLELTNDCDLGCPHCHRGVMGRDVGYMSIPLFRKIVEEMDGFRKAKTMLKLIGLGEPAIHPQIDKALDCLHGKSNIKTRLFTNGLFIESFSPQQILKWPIERLIVSVDGTDDESFGVYRVGGDIHKLRSNLQRLYECREAAKIRSHRIEIRHVVFPKERPEQLAKFEDTWMPMADLIAYNRYLPRNFGKKFPAPLNRCHEIKTVQPIRWDGSVPVCCYQYLTEKQYFLGNAKDTSLKELWQHKKIERIRQQHRANQIDNLSCSQCNFTQIRGKQEYAVRPILRKQEYLSRTRSLVDCQ